MSFLFFRSLSSTFRNVHLLWAATASSHILVYSILCCITWLVDTASRNSQIAIKLCRYPPDFNRSKEIIRIVDELVPYLNLSTLKMETARYSESLGTVYQTTWLHIPEDRSSVICCLLYYFHIAGSVKILTANILIIC
jgi:hypothetical protein